jgi:hypothetical protein
VSPIKKSVWQTANLILWMILLLILFLTGNLLFKVSSYGFETGMKSTVLTLEMLSKPLFSPLKWSSEAEGGILYFVVNIGVSYTVFTFGFWVRQYYRIVGAILLMVFFIASAVWYYVYILSDAVI